MLQQENLILLLNKALNQVAKIRKNEDAVYFCPKCNHKKRKLEVNLFSGKYHCWVCGFAGLSIQSLFRKLNVKNQYYSNIDNLTKETFNPENFSKEKLFSKEAKPLKQAELPAEFISLKVHNKSPEQKIALQYLKKRHVNEFDIYRYNIGYCEHGDYKNRIIIPSYDEFGTLNFFSARSYHETDYLKYKLCESSKNIIGNEILTNFDEALTLVEGSLDAIAVRNNVIPLFGKSLSPMLKLKLLRQKICRVNVLLDNDALNSALDICKFLMSNNIPTYLIQLNGKDPSEVGFESTWKTIESTSILSESDILYLKIQ